jgi:acetyl-CoA carboxylase biotin carboxyl carrier protein
VPLSPEDVRALVAAFDGSEWDEMTLTIDGTHLVLSRTGRPPGTAAASGTATPSAAPPATPSAAPPATPSAAPPATPSAAPPATTPATTPTSAVTPRAAPGSAPTAAPPAAPGAVPPAPDGSAEPRPPAVTGHRVTAPSVGLFWRSPKPGAPPFVEVGDEVGPDDTVCIVEVMKLMNHVRAGVAGTVLAVHPENGQMVEHGDPLFTVEPAR